MTCFDCENCIEDYQGKPYCFAQQISVANIDEKYVDLSEYWCIDFEPTKVSLSLE